MAALLMSEVLPSPWALSTKHREGGRASLKSLDDGALAGLVQKDPADMVAPLATRGWLSGDSENWSGGDTKTGPPRGA